MEPPDLLQSIVQARAQLLERMACGAAPQDTAGPFVEIRQPLGELLLSLERLQHNHAMLLAIVAHGTDALYAKDREGRYLLMNPIGAALFGVPVQAVIGCDDTALYDAESAKRVMEIDRAVLSSGEPYAGESTYSIHGVEKTLATTLATWSEPNGELRGVVGVTRDVTDYRTRDSTAAQERERLRALAAQIVAADERLRRAIARELHDGLGQEIALVELQLSSLRSAQGADLTAALRPIQRLVEQAGRSLRSISFRLSPLALYDLGLIAALECLADEFAERHGLDVTIAASGDVAATDLEATMTVFRAVRQLLSNIVAHAGTHNAAVRIDSSAERLCVVVEDGGAGFHAAQADSHGYGLFGIREQLSRIGGRMTLRSAPGAGTTVTLLVPSPLVNPGDR